jgi:hypothetical protein
MRQREQQRQARMEEQRAAVSKAYAAVQKADREFQQSDEIDPDKGWGDKGIAAQITAVIASALLGFAGMDPFTHIDSVTEQSLAAQRANLDRKKARVDSAQGVQSASENLLGQLRAQLGDEATADDAFRLWALQGVKAQMVAKLSEAGVKVLSAQQREIMATTDQQIAEARRRLELTAATNAPTISRSVSPYTSDQRALDRDIARSGLKQLETAGAKTLDVVADRQAQARGFVADERKASIEAAGKAGEADNKLLRGEGGVYREAQSFAKTVESPWAVKKSIDELLERFPDDSEFPGVDMIGGKQMFSWGEDADVVNALNQVEEGLGRARSQGAITADELDNFQKQLYDGVRLGGDSRMRQNLRAVSDAMADKIQIHERALSPEAREYVNRNKMLPGFEPEVGTAGRGKAPTTSTFAEDE